MSQVVTPAQGSPDAATTSMYPPLDYNSGSDEATVISPRDASCGNGGEHEKARGGRVDDRCHHNDDGDDDDDDDDDGEPRTKLRTHPQQHGAQPDEKEHPLTPAVGQQQVQEDVDTIAENVIATLHHAQRHYITSMGEFLRDCRQDNDALLATAQANAKAAATKLQQERSVLRSQIRSFVEQIPILSELSGDAKAHAAAGQEQCQV